MVARVNMDQVEAGLRSRGITLRDDERQFLRDQVTERLGQFDPDSTITNDFGGTAVKYAYSFVSVLKAMWRNVGSFSLSNIGEWFNNVLAENDRATSFAMLQESMTSLNWALRQSNSPGLMAAADIVTGVSPEGSAPADVSWSVYRQVRSGIPVTPEEVTRGTSLDFARANQRFDVTNATDVAPPGATPPGSSAPALTSVPAKA